MATKGKRQIKLNASLLAMLVADLVEGPATAQGLAEHTGLHSSTIYRTVKAFRKRGLVHIAAWDKDSVGRWGVPVFGWGDKPDAPRKRKSATEVQRDWRAKKARAPLVYLGSPSVGMNA